MKAVVVLYAAIAFASVAALGQGQFFFNTHDLTAGNVLTFVFNGMPASGNDLFVEVSAGPEAQHLTPLTPLLALNRTGAGAGFTSPFSQVYTVSGMTAGQTATVAVNMFQGTSSVTATFSMFAVLGVVQLTEPPTPPNEVAIGAKTIAVVPEPSTWAMLLLGLGGLVFGLPATAVAFNAKSGR
jgi:hypothetical protein